MKRLFTLLLILLIPSFLSAQDKGQLEFTLDDCLEIALTKNKDLRMEQLNVESASASVTSAFGDFLPSVYVSANYSRVIREQPYVYYQGQLFPTSTNEKNSYSINAGASLNIFNGFARESNYSGAQSNYKSNLLSSQHIEKVTTYQVYDLFIDVIRKKRILDIRKEDIASGIKELERIQAQHEAGMIPIGIVYSQETDVGNREYSLVVAENDYDIAKTNLLITMGMSPDLDAKFLDNDLPDDVDNAEVERFNKEYSLSDGLIKEAFANRLDHQSRMAYLDYAEENVDIAQSSYYPTIDLGLNWRWGNYELNNFSELSGLNLGINFSYFIFNNFNTTEAVQKAKVGYEQTLIGKEKLDQTIRQNVLMSFYNLDAAEKQLDITQKALRAAEMNNRSFEERFKVGTASITDKIVANTQYLQAQINRINAIYSYFLAQKQVLFSIGKL